MLGRIVEKQVWIDGVWGEGGGAMRVGKGVWGCTTAGLLIYWPTQFYSSLQPIDQKLVFYIVHDFSFTDKDIQK